MRVIQMNPFPDKIKSAPTPPPSLPKVRQPSFFDIKDFRADDWILIGIIAALILEGSDDYILLCALGYLFIMGF